MREARADFGELVHEVRAHLGHALHVAAVLRMQEAARDLRARAPAVLHHLGTLAEHLLRDRELFVHDRRRALLAGQLERRFPAGDGHFTRHVLGEFHGLRRAVLHAEAGDGAAEAEEAHAVAALAQDLAALLLERQAVDLHHVVEHAREHAHHFAILVPVELGELRERMAHEAREVHRAEGGTSRTAAAAARRRDWWRGCSRTTSCCSSH